MAQRAEQLRGLQTRGEDVLRDRVPGAPAVLESLEREAASGSGLLAGGIAYRFFLWLVPFGLVVAAITSFWSESSPASLDKTTKSFGIGAGAASSARTAIAAGGHGKWYFLVFGLGLLLYFGVSAVKALRVSHQIAWAHREPRLRNSLGASVLFTVLIVAVIGITLGARLIQHEAGTGFGLAATLALSVVYAGAALFVMRLLPHADAPTRALLPGAVVSAVGMQCLHLLVVYYLAAKLERAPELYGALGAATVFLLWLYLIARVIVSAAFLNATLWRRRHPAA